MRTFTDSAGIEWTIFEFSDPSLRAVRPEMLRHPEYRNGWLLFQSATEKRRLPDFPSDWRDFSAAELEKLCARARVARGDSNTPSATELPRYRD